MYDTVKNKVLKIKDIHFYWRFKDLAVSLLINRFKFIFKVTSETFNAKMNYDIFTFSLNLSDSFYKFKISLLFD